MTEEKRDLIVNDRRHVPVDAAPVGGATPMEMLASAIQRGLSPETLDKLMALQERWDKAQSMKAFQAALAAAQTEYPEIEKGKRVSYEVKDKKPSDKDVSYSHERLADVTRAILPVLGRHGIAVSWDINQEIFDSGSQLIKVTCNLSREGYTKSVTMQAPPDDSGKKNTVQKIASTVTYLKRYTLNAAAGSAAAEKDDDAIGVYDATADAIDSHEEASPLLDMIDHTTRDELSGLSDRIKAELDKQKLSQAAISLVRAHYSARMKRENELQNDSGE